MLVKLTPITVEKALAALPSEWPEERRGAFRNALLHPPKGPVDRIIGFGHAETPIAGIAVLDTPGHTPGHISLYHRASKTLIAGDALVLTGGRLQLPGAALNSDDAQALRSLEQLEAMEIDAVICYHGGCFRGDVRTQLRELLA
ncbi:MBL fold metallo-hydrolase [Paenibacillus glycinis]|uniref:MBL fold metallo-hydrolase n=1 Tax=Paenibacillus glycinis TaxID=2697035 RepID=A0ABW9XIV3_9BACL|nr:MBL fold metallo-hydrolase [Paenibacillus glycinis]NBD22528.1 MBL fold metallo-hydrolase [Paenibacillus glycinis]